MLQHLTDRQQLLFSRLVTLGEWATNRKFPLRVLEIIGFGSFFRGKPRPNDVDLVLRVENSDRATELKRLVDLVRSLRKDWDLQEKFESPSAAISELVMVKDQRVSDISDVDIDLFLWWIDGYSWNMLFHQDYVGGYDYLSSHGISKRLIKASLPNLNVVLFVGPKEPDKPVGLRCGFTVSIWSQDRPDTSANLSEVLADTSVRENAARELAFFTEELAKISATVRLHEAEIELLRNMPKRRRPPADSSRWFEMYAKDHPDLTAATAERDRAYKPNSQTEDRVPVASRDRALPELAKEVDELRAEIKGLYRRNDLLEPLRDSLAYFKSGKAESDLPAEEYVATCLLSRGSKAAKIKCAEFLRSFGLPVDRVLNRIAKEERRYSRAAQVRLKLFTDQ
jgi:predicted nucleotidyltransferase